MKARLPTLCAVTLTLALPSAQATSFALLLVPGISGECTEKAFRDWIELTGLDLAGPLHAGTPGSFSVHKRIDKASPLLARQCAMGTHIKEAKLVLREVSPVPESPPVICSIHMTDLMVSSFNSASDGADARPTESVSLNFSRIEFKYFARDGSQSSAFLNLGLSTLDGDHDGMPDAWEKYYGLPPASNNAGGDSDGDGLTDYQEFQLGTNPVSGDTRFSATAGLVPEDPNSIDISWNAVPGTSYFIEWSPDLKQPFGPIGDSQFADSSLMKVRITKSGATGFFRVRPADP